MARFHLRASDNSRGGTLEPLLINVAIHAETVEEAIAEAKAHPVDYFVGNGNYAWLVDESDKVVWSIKMEEAAGAQRP